MSAADAGGGSNSGNSNDKKRIHSPPVELPSSNCRNFYEEAKITQTEEIELKRKFGKFCTKEDTYLTLDNFCCLLQYYDVASAQHFESYFHAIDRDHDDKLNFQEFFQGCCAADPTTVHILNSFTGFERSKYIFDFYDTNRTETLDFEEFSRLIADCLSLPNTNANEEQIIKNQAVEKARELGALDETGPGGLTHFTCIKFKKFYEFIQNERLRGTSRLFRFHKSIIKPRHSRRGGSSTSGGGTERAAGAERSGATTSAASAERSATAAPGGQASQGGQPEETPEDDPPSDREDCDWHAHLLELDAQYNPGGDQQPGAHGGAPDRPTPPAYLALPAPAPAAPSRQEQEPASASTDARAIARKVLRGTCAPHFEGLLPDSADDGDSPFTLVTLPHLRSLCSAATRLLELEDMVLTGLQPPVKVFGSLHGQLLDMLSHFRWLQPPAEDVGDILYTTYVFTGDYCDRGTNCLEVLTVLLSLKVAHPHRVALLRGHHENRHLNYHLGLRLECERRLGPVDGPKIYEHLNKTFEHLSLAAVIGGQILVLGPNALPASLTRLDQLRRYKKPLLLPHPLQPRSVQPLDRLNEQVLLELFTPPALMPRELGSQREATADQVKTFCVQHKLAAIVRSRQMPTRGFAFDCGGRLITVASCVNYCDLPEGNDAAILCITKEEGSPNLQVRPKVLTARVASLYSVLGSQSFNGRSAPSRARWPVQQRAATPGRVTSSSRQAPADAESGIAPNAAAVVVLPDRSMVADGSASLAVFPAFGPQRMPGGLLPKHADGGRSVDSPRAAGYGRSMSDAREALQYSSSLNTNEDWLGSGAGRDRPGLRGSLGPRRNSTSVTQKGSPLGDNDGPTPKGATSPARGAPPRTPVPTPGGSSSVAPAQRGMGPGVADGATGSSASAQRRGATSPSSEGTRLSLGAGGTAPAGPPVAPLFSGSSGPSKDPKATPPTRAAASNGKAKDGRGPSRPPATTAPSPKPAVAAPRNGVAARRSPEGMRGDAQPGVSAPASPRQSSSTFVEDARVPPVRLSADGELKDPQSLALVLQDSSSLQSAALPAAPAAYLQQATRGSEQPLVLHLCRVWVEAGLSDKDWGEAVRMFENGLCDQPRQQPKGPRGPMPGISGAAEEEAREARWTLETFSVWLLKLGRRLRECNAWFRAFDLDQDDMVSVADFLQGLAAAAAPRTPLPNTSSGLCVALAIFRLLDLERRPSLDARGLEGLLADAQVSFSGLDLAMPMAQIAQRATDFDFFRTSLLPRLTATGFRLRVFGGTMSES